MKNQPPLFQRLRIAVAFLTFIFVGAVAVAQDAPMGIVKGTVLDGLEGRPMAEVRVRLIGLTEESLTNGRGEFFLEAPAKTYAGLVMAMPDGELRLIETEILVPASQILNLKDLALEKPAALTDTPPTDLAPLAEAPLTPPILRTPEAVGPNLLTDPIPAPRTERRPFGPTLEATGPIMERIPPAAPETPTQLELDREVHPLLPNARMMAASGNFAGADRAYEEYLNLFPLDGPVKVEHGVMVFHNIQQAKGRGILRQAIGLPGLGPREMATIDSHLPPPIVVIHEAPRKTAHVHIRLKNRHRSH